MEQEHTKKRAIVSLAEKKLMQCMIDAFHMKAIRMMQVQLKKSMAEIVPLLKQGGPEIDHENDEGIISVKQLIRIDEHSTVVVKGNFKRSASPHHIPLPMIDTLQITTHRIVPDPVVN